MMKRRKTTGRRYQGIRPSYSGWNPRQFTRGEWKYQDYTMNMLSNTTGAGGTCNGLVPGTGANQRIGMKIALRTIELRGAAYREPGHQEDDTIRFQLFIDKQTNAGPTEPYGAQLTPVSAYGFRNLTHRKRFKMLLDKTWHVGGSDGTTSDRYNCKRNFHFYIKLRRPIIVEYNSGVAGDLTDIEANSLHVYTISSLVHPSFSHCDTIVRIRYTDM